MGLHEKAGSSAVRLADGGRRRKPEGIDELKRADATPLRGGFGGDEAAGMVVVEVLMRKYTDHLPLYRQAAAFMRGAGFDLSRKNCLWPCRVRLRRSRCPRARGRELAPCQQLESRPRRRRHRQCHRIRKTPWHQCHEIPGRRPPTPRQRHHFSGSCPDSSRLTARPLRPTSRLTAPDTAQPRAWPTADRRRRRQHGLVRRLPPRHLLDFSKTLNLLISEEKTTLPPVC